MGCSGLIRSKNDQSPPRFRRNQKTGLTQLSSPQHYSTLGLCKRARTFSLKRAPPNHKVKPSGPTRIAPYVVQREAEVTIENVNMDSLPLVVKPPSQAEEASVVEATGAKSNPITGVRVGVTPQKSDSHRKEDPHVGGCLMKCRRAWVEENCSSSVFNMITSGFILPFRLKLRLTRHPLSILGYKDQHKDLALA